MSHSDGCQRHRAGHEHHAHHGHTGTVAAFPGAGVPEQPHGDREVRYGDDVDHEQGLQDGRSAWLRGRDADGERDSAGYLAVAGLNASIC